MAKFLKMSRLRLLLSLVVGSIIGGGAWAASNPSILAEVSAALGVNNAIRQILHIGDDGGIGATLHTVVDIDGDSSALSISTGAVSVAGDFGFSGTMDSLQFTTGLPAPTHSEGLIFYDDNEKTLAVYNNQADVTLQLGQEIYIRATNKTGVAITNGSLVYVSGAQGSRPTIVPAQSDSAITSDVLAMATHEIADNATGFCTTFGLVHDLNTSNETAGDAIYLSASSAGAWTKTAPIEPNFIIQVGTVLFSNNETGLIFVHMGPTDVARHMVIQSLAINDSLNIAGDVTYTGGGGIQTGGISVVENTTPDTLNSSAKVQITAFDTNNPSNGAVVPDHTEDHIIIGRAGIYMISGSVVARNNAAQTHDIEINAFKNNGASSIGVIHAHRTLAGGVTNAGSISLGGGNYLFAANDTLELWATTDDSGDRSVTFEDVVLTVFQVGGSP